MNYVVSAATNPDRVIRTNKSNLSKSIQTLIDEGFPEVIVRTEDHLKNRFIVGEKVRVIANKTFHKIPLGSIVQVCQISDNDICMMDTGFGGYWYLTPEEIEKIDK